MNQEIVESIRQLCKERGLEPELIYQAIEEALVAAYKREFTAKTTENIQAHIDRETGVMSVLRDVQVVQTVDDKMTEISLADAKAIDSEFELGDVLQYEIDPSLFGRLAAQAAKFAINQSLIAAERERIQAEYSNRIGELASGVVQRKDRREVIVDIGRAEAVLTGTEQSRLDEYNFNERMLFLIKRVDDKKGRPVIYVSRSHPDLVKKLFEQEVPEIASGIVEIVNVSREAGSRTKISVATRDENVDPLGACVGQRGMRVQNIMNELRGEKIDIIEWDPDETVYIRNALKPANAVRVELTEMEESRQAQVVVPDSQLSLAIGKSGQNARLAARLTGWKIDIKSESQVREAIEQDFMSRFEAAADAVDSSKNEDEEDSFEEVDSADLVEAADTSVDTEVSEAADLNIAAIDEDDREA
ncbi:MAG: transcription termination/antitermination protein NusA [Clostridia bacterium]|nr:transcription termination/antitermination protein NusA [Clostridia bacterium]NLF20865.1 transcription termination/antitermination protein NusA [Clostridiaceae bacterium]